MKMKKRTQEWWNLIWLINGDFCSHKRKWIKKYRFNYVDLKYAEIDSRSVDWFRLFRMISMLDWLATIVVGWTLIRWNVDVAFQSNQSHSFRKNGWFWCAIMKQLLLQIFNIFRILFAFRSDSSLFHLRFHVLFLKFALIESG